MFVYTIITNVSSQIKSCNFPTKRVSPVIQSYNIKRDLKLVANLLHDLIRQSSDRWPKSIAIQQKDISVTYQELDLSTTQIANLLTQTGITKGQRIGLLAHKSIAAYQGIYAILKAGCAYVPLDRRAPGERLSYICNDCDIDTLIVTNQVFPKLNQILENQQSIKSVIVLDSIEPQQLGSVNVLTLSDIDTQSKKPKQPFNIVDSDLAYIFYTSGSTGKPKGVMISHHVSMSFVTWACKHTALIIDDRVSGHAPLHFDLSIFDIFATAQAGATLLPVPDGASTFPSRLLDWMINNRISVWYSVPSILSMMAQNPKFKAESYPDLRLLIFAGEVFPVPYLKQWLACLPELTFMNWFGPTETNVITSYTVTITAEQLLTPIPIGRSTDNADLYCLDENGDLVTEPGKSGELFARGPCVALGYWGDIEKTDAKFLSNQNKPYLNDRTFKTGDIVTLDDNGDFIFQGRNDHLVKSRGYRIELGEVEAAFYQQEILSEAAIIPFADDLIGNKLIAFVATKKSTQKGYDLIQDSLAEKAHLNKLISEVLPSYMIPSDIKVLTDLPKTSNGKIDRQKLAKTNYNNQT
jgi:amino acid adenylation domain-containing protein